MNDAGSRSLIPASLLAVLFSAAGCWVQPVCFSDADCADDAICLVSTGDQNGHCIAACGSDADCPAGARCDLATGRCSAAECLADDDCHPRFACVQGVCVSRDPLICPSDMVPVEDQFCVDVYEASRPDATREDAGADESRATSRASVLPWQVRSNGAAQAACEAAGKTLCTERQWYLACATSAGKAFSYGDEYEPSTCNGIDKYCYCDVESCESRSPCPFAGCHQSCGAGLRLDPTGENPSCTNAYGVFDINGNLWEHVYGGDDMRVRGGAFNCRDSMQLHSCDYIPGTWTPSARGFRCCSLGLSFEPSADGASEDGRGPGDSSPEPGD